MNSSNGRNNRRTEQFRSLYESIPDDVKAVAVAAFKCFCNDPSHHSLRHHALQDMKKGRHQVGSFSVSITMKYRAIYVYDESTNTNVWYWVGCHSDYNNFTGKG